MSRSILKSPDKRLIPVSANEGVDSECDTHTKIQPWAPVDDEPMMMGDMQHEVNRMQRDLQKMHHQMMTNFPGPMDPLPLPPLQPFPFPNMHGHMPQPMLGGPGDPHLLPPRNGSPSMRAIKDTSSPSGSLKKHHGAVVLAPGPGPMTMGPGHFGPPDMMIPPHHAMPMMPMGLPPAASAPIITEDEYGYRDMELILDVKGFMPEDIHIHTEGKVLHIHAIRLSAKHNSSGGGGIQDAQVAKECRRQYTLPDVVRAENLRCFVNPKGQLTVEGPLGPDIMRIKNKKKVKFVSGNK